MDMHVVWKVLGIEETKDTELIKKVYHDKLKNVNPEDDQAGFMQLREAYERAVAYAENPGDVVISDEYEKLKDGTEVDRFIYRMNLLYEDLESRKDEDEWSALLNSYDDDLDGELQERVLVYIMSHHQFPWAIWKKLDEKFHIQAETEILKEKFPENFLGYINYYISHDAFIDFDIFEGDTSHHVDEYINRYLDLKTQIEQLEDIHDTAVVSKISHDFEVLDEYDIHHPFADAEKLHFWLRLSEEKDMPQEAFDIADRLASDYPDNFYIGYYTGLTFLEFDKVEIAKQLFTELLEIQDDSYLAKLGMLKTQKKAGEYADAKENCLDLLDTEDRNPELNVLLDELNDCLVPQYEEKMKDNPEDTETIIELGWCYFQQQRFDKVEEVLTSVEKEKYKEYDYTNLMGRNYLAMEQYDKAISYLLCWRSMIDSTEDDGTKDSKKKLNRKGFSHFSVGLCHWNLGQKELGEKEIKDGIELENASQYAMSYYDQLSQFYLLDHAYEKAYDLCTDLIKKDENFYPAYLRRQEAAFELHKGQDVIDDFYQCKRLFPGYVKPYVLAMKVFYFARQYSDAMNIYEQAKEQHLESDELQLYYFKTKRCSEKDIEKLRPLIREFYQFKTNCLEKQKAALNKEKRQSIQDDEEGSDIANPEDLYLEDALFRLALHDDRSAMESINEGLKLYPGCVGLLELKADCLWDANRQEEAYQCYTKLVNMGIKSYNIYLMLGKYYYKKLGNAYDDTMKQAIQCFKNAYKIDPKGQENLYYLTRIFRKKTLVMPSDKEQDDAYGCSLHYAKCLYDLEKNAFNAIELGLVYEFHHEYEQALMLYKQAMSMEADNIYAHNNAGNVYLKLNKLTEAENELLCALKLENDDEPTMVYEYLIDLYEKKGDYQLAATYAVKQLSRYKKDRDLWMRLVEFYDKLGQYQDVIKAYQKLFELCFIKKYELCYHKAKYLYLDGKKIQAMKLYHEALTLVRSDPEAKKIVIASRQEWKK